MKKVLMASSAIVGAAVLAASPAAAQELTLNAFQVFMASGGDADQENSGDEGGSDRGFAFSTNTEVHVKGEIMADNGITFGFRVEFEADSGEENNVDENSIYAQGSFGKLEFGNNDGAEDTFMVNGSNSGVDYGGVGNPTSNFLSSAFAGQARTSVDFANGVDSSDGTKITYTTPNFNGFSAGVSYAPDSSDGGDGNKFNRADDDGIHDHVGVGLGYDGEFNGVGIELGLVAAFGTADAEPEDDVYGIGGGVAISYAGFTFATGAVFDDADGNGGEGYAFDAGIGYATGPWSFSVNGIYSEDDDSDDELLAGSANVGYSVAPGVRVFLTGYIGEEDLGSGDDNEIVAVTSGLAVSF
ncbi:porin [Pelagibius litoralis]|uniref:Porin n=1 Tax=Pelagibius litoralis TaxID=374515 RepID=A0A967KHW6_9PROT|nr:porin [Pelagibius litoralis]NIA71686.1 porin [Pelagibius litoralis]